MKKLIKLFIILYLFLIPILCDAKGLSLVCGRGVTTAASGCDPGIGNNFDETGNQVMPSNQMWCWKFTSSCAGTLGYGYIGHHGTDSDNAKICVFNDDGVGSEPEDATQVGNCGSATSSTDEFKETTAKLTGSISDATAYWVCIVADTTGWNLNWKLSGGTCYWNAITGSYTTPTTNAGDAWSTMTRLPAAYVVIE